MAADGSSAALGLSMRLVGANTHAHLVGVGARPGRVSYLLGNDPRNWRRNIQTYTAVRIASVYPGISLTYQGDGSSLEYSFVLAPRADAARIRLAMTARADGKQPALSLDAHGNLVAHTTTGSLIQRAPRAFQQTAHGRVPVSARFTLAAPRVLRLVLGPYDHHLSLVIDPSLTYASYAGGGNEDAGLAVARDSSGALYLAGYTTAVPDPNGNLTDNFPAAGSLPSAPTTVYVAKIAPNGQGAADLVYATFLGASWDAGAGTQATAIAVDGLGQAYVTGSTTGEGFPATSNAFQPTDPMPNSGTSEGFAAVLNAQGTSLSYATYLGGSGDTRINALALGANGLIAVAGQTAAPDFPVTNGSTLNGPDDAFVGTPQPSLAGTAQLTFSTYFGGEGDDETTALAVEPSGLLDIAGNTSSATGIATSGATQSGLGGGVNAFIARLDPTATGGSAANVQYATYLGGGGLDSATSIALAPNGSLIVAGYTDSGAPDGTTAAFPTTLGAYQTEFGAGSLEAFVSEVQPATVGTAGLLYSTLLGVPAAGEQVRALAVAVDTTGVIYLGGLADGGLPTTASAVSGLSGGVSGAFVAELLPDATLSTASQLAYVSYLDSAGLDAANGLVLDAANGYVAVVGSATGGVTATTGAYQTAANGGNDAFIASLLPQPQPAPSCQVTAQVSSNGTQVALLAGTTPRITPFATLDFSISGGASFNMAAVPAQTVTCSRPGLGTATATITGVVDSATGTGVQAGDPITVNVTLAGSGGAPRLVVLDTTSGTTFTLNGPFGQGSVVTVSPVVTVLARPTSTPSPTSTSTPTSTATSTATATQTPVPTFTVGKGAVAAGWFHSLAIKSGTMWAWGRNDLGELGNGTTTNASTPVQVSNLGNVTAVAANGYRSEALKSGGTVWGWGYNGSGQLGNGTKTTALTAVQAGSLTGITAIGAGCDHSLALKSDGTVWARGGNSYGQLGNGTTTSALTPVPVSNLTGITAIAAGCDHSLALKADGTVWAWGYNHNGQLGNNSTRNASTPVQVSNLTGVTTIAAGGYFSLAAKSAGTAWTWGYNVHGQLGNGTKNDSSIPVQVANLTNVQSLAGGDAHSLAITSSGAVWAWGYNNYGQLGIGSTNDSFVPVQVSSLGNAAVIAAGAYHSVAATSAGVVWDWGNNQFGQLGNGTANQATVPIQVMSLSQ